MGTGRLLVGFRVFQRFACSYPRLNFLDMDFCRGIFDDFCSFGFGFGLLLLLRVSSLLFLALVRGLVLTLVACLIWLKIVLEVVFVLVFRLLFLLLGRLYRVCKNNGRVLALLAVSAWWSCVLFGGQ